MASEFFKGYAGLFLGSIAEAPLPTRWVFLACLSLSDMDGNFVSTIEGIARYANVSVEEARAAMDELQAPDPQSTTPDEDGRRVVSTNVNKWCVVNKRAYSDKSRSVERAEYLREKKRESRARIASKSTGVNKCQQVNLERRERGENIREENTPPPPSGGKPQTPSKKFEPPSYEQAVAYGAEIELSEVDARRFVDYGLARGWTVGKAQAPMKDWRAALRTWKGNKRDFESGNGSAKPAPFRTPDELARLMQ